MTFKSIVRSVIFILLLTLSATALGAGSWTEDALLNDGRIIKVYREVENTLSFSRDSFLKSWPDKFSLEFEHPDTKKLSSGGVNSILILCCLILLMGFLIWWFMVSQTRILKKSMAALIFPMFF